MENAGSGNDSDSVLDTMENGGVALAPRGVSSIELVTSNSHIPAGQSSPPQR